MWRIVSINNETHVLTVRHTDGEMKDLVVPESARRTHADKMAWIKSQTSAYDLVRTANKAKEAKKWKRPYALYAIMVAETVAIIALLLRH